MGRLEDLLDDRAEAGCDSVELPIRDVRNLLTELDAARADADSARPLIARYSETRDAALTDDRHRCEAWLAQHDADTGDGECQRCGDRGCEACDARYLTPDTEGDEV